VPVVSGNRAAKWFSALLRTCFPPLRQSRAKHVGAKHGTYSKRCDIPLLLVELGVVSVALSSVSLYT